MVLVKAAALSLLFVSILAGTVSSHGILYDPPGRSSMWRYGFDVPKNTDDHSLYCGGFDAQYNEVNQGRCGECGDMWSLPRPRANDEGGLYGTGIIGKTYGRGQLVEMKVELSASHLGYFEFRLCPNKTSANELVTQECLDQHLLELEDGSYRYHVTSWSQVYHSIMVKLPADITCDYCVVQWYYRGGNNAGPCEETPSGYDCGRQETFVNCADVSIL